MVETCHQPDRAKTVQVEPVATDRYGRTVAFVKVGDALANEELIRQGLAWVFTRYCDRPICQQWKQLEVEAREARRGLWSKPNAMLAGEFWRQGRK
jgi:micrococcal nuclease